MKQRVAATAALVLSVAVLSAADSESQVQFLIKEINATESLISAYSRRLSVLHEVERLSLQNARFV